MPNVDVTAAAVAVAMIKEQEAQVPSLVLTPHIHSDRVNCGGSDGKKTSLCL